MTSRSWCFTINNYTLEEIDNLEFGIAKKYRYMICGFEKGEKKGTPHIQGYVEFHAAKRKAGVKKLISKRAHVEASKMKNRVNARDYCTKGEQTKAEWDDLHQQGPNYRKNPEWVEFGDWEAGGQGTRNDLRGIMEMIKEKKKMIEIMEEAPEAMAQNLRFADRYKELVEKEETREFRKVSVEAYVGDAGTGKTRKAHEENPGIYTVNPDETFPFDGYDGEETILIDDFYGGLKYHYLLRILDGHQLRVNIKGGHRYARWTKVIITSNKKPADWYAAGLTPALARRITNVTTFCNEEAGNTRPPLVTMPEDVDNILSDDEFLDI